MNRRSFAWHKFNQSTTPTAWVDQFWVTGLLLAALLMVLINLGMLPLRDWDEGIVAQVAQEIWQSPLSSLTWLHPTLNGQPYLSKPPLMHWLIALTYSMGGVNEWTARLPSAILTALSVPVMYGIGREVFLRRTPAIFAAAVYLTFLPIARHARLAMLDGAILCFFLLLLFCLLRARRDLRWGLGVGLALGALGLTKGMIAVLLGAIAFTFIWLDTPRLLSSGYLWSGLLVGSLPAVGWYGAQWWHYRQDFLAINLLQQSLSRVVTPVEGNQGPPWYYLLDVLKFGLPWILFLPQGMRSTWENRNLSWAKLVSVWLIVYLVAISLMRTKLPWYGLPLYPALALIVGKQFDAVWDFDDVLGTAVRPDRFPRLWLFGVNLLAIAGWIGCGYFSEIGPHPAVELQILSLSIALTMSVAALLIIRRDSQFIAVLLWGMYVSLVLLMISHQWNWELNEAYAVKPVAELLQTHTPTGRTVLTSYPNYRPSLNFYSHRTVVPAALNQLRVEWQRNPRPFLLVDRPTLDLLQLHNTQQLGQAEGWILLTRMPAIASK